MSKPLLLIVTVALLLPAAASAQAPTSPSVAADLQAEHYQWEADDRKWAAEHVALAQRLRAIAAGIERGTGKFQRHDSEIAVHGAALKRGVDSEPLELTHARLRSEHEDARIAHDHLLDAVKTLETTARDDERTRTIEEDQGEPGAAPRK